MSLLKAAACFSTGLHVTHIDSVLHVSDLTVPAHIKLFLHNPLLIRKIAGIQVCDRNLNLFPHV